VFLNNRNKQKINRNSSKFVQISTFLIHHTKSSVCFGCLDTDPKHRNKPEIFFELCEKQAKTDWVSVCFGSNRENKVTVSRTPLIENGFGRFFRFVSTKFCLFWLFWYRSKTPKQSETNWKKSFLVSGPVGTTTWLPGTDTSSRG
jgi:hypothetical protein